jgi:hypothetical protein
MQRLAGVRHVRHQLWCCLEIPVCVAHVGMAQIGAQGCDVTRDRLGIVRTVFKGANSECVPLMPRSELEPLD